MVEELSNLKKNVTKYCQILDFFCLRASVSAVSPEKGCIAAKLLYNVEITGCEGHYLSALGLCIGVRLLSTFF